MRFSIFHIFILLMCFSLNSYAQKIDSKLNFHWSQLPEIPDKFGFAGSFAGVSNGSLIVAGGANFPDGGAPWTGSKKAWSDQIFILEKTGGRWKTAGKLPEPLGYGVSVTYNGELICFGGSNAVGHSGKVFGIRYKEGKVVITQYPDMPSTLANSAGVLVGDKVFIAGGLIHPDDRQAASIFWTLDLAKPRHQQSWDQLPALPGGGRMLSVAGTQNGKFYLFSGAALTTGPDGVLKRKYLNEAYVYDSKNGWKRLADMPGATVAAAGPAFSLTTLQLIFGGDDGSLADQAAELKSKHPGFSKKIIGYDVLTNTWHQLGSIITNKKIDADHNPNNSVWAPVTTSMVLWNGGLIFPGGEVKPAVRTPRVLVATLKDN